MERESDPHLSQSKQMYLTALRNILLCLLSMPRPNAIHLGLITLYDGSWGQVNPTPLLVLLTFRYVWTPVLGVALRLCAGGLNDLLYLPDRWPVSGAVRPEYCHRFRVGVGSGLAPLSALWGYAVVCTNRHCDEESPKPTDGKAESVSNKFLSI